MLERTAAGLIHRGTVSFRGPAALPFSLLQEGGMAVAVRQGLEFTASWFGFPFDAVNLRRKGMSPLSWGFWQFEGDQLGASLLTWRRRTPEDYARLVGRHGIEVLEGKDVNGGGSAPVLCLTTSEGSRLWGALAEKRIASDAALLGALALAGRDHGAQLSQIEIGMQALAPLTSVPSRTAAGEQPAGDRIVSARGWAVMFFLALRLGPTEGAHVMRLLDLHDQPAADETALLERLAECLALAAPAEAPQVRRILSSPELLRG